MNALFRTLNRLRLPDVAYYWLLDRLTDNDGWRPLDLPPDHMTKPGPCSCRGCWPNGVSK